MCGCAEACMQKRECDPCISFSWLPTSGTKTTREPTHKSRSGIQDRCPPALLQWPVRCRHNSNTPWPRLLIDINPATRVQELAVQVFGGEYTETLKMVGGAQRSTCLGAFFFFFLCLTEWQGVSYLCSKCFWTFWPLWDDAMLASPGGRACGGYSTLRWKIIHSIDSCHLTVVDHFEILEILMLRLTITQ